MSLPSPIFTVKACEVIAPDKFVMVVLPSFKFVVKLLFKSTDCPLVSPSTSARVLFAPTFKLWTSLSVTTCAFVEPKVNVPSAFGTTIVPDSAAVIVAPSATSEIFS